MLETQGFEAIENITSPLLTFNISGKSYDIVVVTVGQRDSRPYFPIFTLNKNNLKKFREAFTAFETAESSNGVISNGKIIDDIIINKWKLYTGDGTGVDQPDNLSVSFNLINVEENKRYLIIEMISLNETVAKLRLDNYDAVNFNRAISEDNIKIITDKAKSKKRPKISKSVAPKKIKEKAVKNSSQKNSQTQNSKKNKKNEKNN